VLGRSRHTGRLGEPCRPRRPDGDARRGNDAYDITRCDYWRESTEAEPRFFVGEFVWQARWPDGNVTRGEFDARSIGEPGVVTLRQKR
jgi:hypothetical protein